MQKTINAPFIKTDERIWSVSADIIIVCIVMLVQSVFNFGFPALIRAGICTALTALVEVAACLIVKKPLTVTDLSGIKSGLLLSMLLPPNAPLWFAAAAGLICGGIRASYIKKSSMPIIPAAVTASLFTIIFPSIMFGYVSPSGFLSTFSEQSAGIAAKSSAHIIMQNSACPYSFPELFLGVAPGPIGASFIALCVCGFIYLALKRSINTVAVAAFIVECAAMAAAFPRGDYSAFASIAAELTSGSLLFCGIFFIGDKYTSPKHTVASIAYGVVAATLCMATRYIGLYEQTGFFIAVIMCIASPYLEDLMWKVFKA